jgi:hypothetical protein
VERNKPCTGCGECCKEQICQFGKTAFLNVDGLCPGLIWQDGRYWCSLIKQEMLQKESIIANALKVGEGCYKNIPEHLETPNVIKDVFELITSIEK